MSTETILPRLRETVQCAYERSPFYQRLYRRLPDVSCLNDFHTLPLVTRRLLKEADGATDLVSLDDGQLVMELSGLSSEYDISSFTPVENEYDMERRYRRVVRMLSHAGARPDNTALLADDLTIYFAAQIERVLPWPIVIALCGDDHSMPVPDKMRQVGSSATLIAATQKAIAGIPDTCRTLVTFNSHGTRDLVLPVGCSTFDVFTLNMIPWLAISRGSGVYDTLDGIPDEDGDRNRQFYLERGVDGTLIVTVLTSSEAPGALPVVRYDTRVPVEEANEYTFTLVRKDRRL